MRSFTQDPSDAHAARVNRSIAEDAVYTAPPCTLYTCDNSTLWVLPSFSEARKISFRVLVDKERHGCLIQVEQDRDRNIQKSAFRWRAGGEDAAKTRHGY
jgi:hypothetical protein